MEYKCLLLNLISTFWHMSGVQSSKEHFDIFLKSHPNVNPLEQVFSTRFFLFPTGACGRMTSEKMEKVGLFECEDSFVLPSTAFWSAMRKEKEHRTLVSFLALSLIPCFAFDVCSSAKNADGKVRFSKFRFSQIHENLS